MLSLIQDSIQNQGEEYQKVVNKIKSIIEESVSSFSSSSNNNQQQHPELEVQSDLIKHISQKIELLFYQVEKLESIDVVQQREKLTLQDAQNYQDSIKKLKGFFKKPSQNEAIEFYSPYYIYNKNSPPTLRDDCRKIIDTILF